jgi:hypothetical protein
LHGRNTAKENTPTSPEREDGVVKDRRSLHGRNTAKENTPTSPEREDGVVKDRVRDFFQ